MTHQNSLILLIKSKIRTASAVYNAMNGNELGHWKYLTRGVTIKASTRMW